jgi:GH18 family chitinase
VLSTAYVVQIPDVLSTYEFNLFKEIQGAKRILSIGGWAFSTDPSTYMIFREGVTSTNRLTMATNIANFINDNDLDGVNIDWEYEHSIHYFHSTLSWSMCLDPIANELSSLNV